MANFFTSDTHFGHERIIELSNRPFADVGAMNEALIENWNSVVSPEDTVYHLGDVAMGKIAESLPLVKRLNGTKVLILGNHDRPFMEKQQITRYERKEHPEKVAKHATRAAEAMAAYGEVFDAIHTHYALQIEDRWVSLSHFPYDGDSHDGDRFTEARLPDNGRILIHGHTHADTKVTHSKAGSLQIHVGVDAWDYKPVSEEAVKMLITAYTGMWDYPETKEA